MSERIRRHVIARGRVQGVWYRGATEEQARARTVDGWVRNLPDGSVEAVFEGPAEAVEALVDWCRRGPRWAQVESLEVTDAPAGGDLRGFEIRR
jgi:acylphosphatase